MFKKIMTGFVFALFAISVNASSTTKAPTGTTAAPAVNCPATSGINGLWEAFYLDTGARSAYICIQTTSGGHLSGKIVKNYPRRGENPTICEKCPGNKQGARYIGLEIVWGFTDNGNGEWVDGHILDAESGDVYTAKAQLQGKELHLRGYVLTPMFGKTTVWKKVDKIQ